LHPTKYISWERFLMPRKTGNSKSNSKQPADWQKFDFVEIRLTEEDKADFKAKYQKDAQIFFSETDTLLKSGYKFSVSYDTGNNAVIASLTCKEALDPNFNYVMTARAGEYWEALALVMYKHMFMCDDGDWAAETRANDSQWG
jgi:hypothetical protein